MPKQHVGHPKPRNAMVEIGKRQHGGSASKEVELEDR